MKIKVTFINVPTNAKEVVLSFDNPEADFDSNSFVCDPRVPVETEYPDIAKYAVEAKLYSTDNRVIAIKRLECTLENPDLIIDLN